MPKNAREGAQHWNKQVGELRAKCKEWKWKEHLAEAFDEQARESHRKRYRAQKECLLLRLQLAADDGLVVPALGATAAEGFCGWLGFVVAPGEADRFRAELAGMFPEGSKEPTLEQAFRRAGLVPEGSQWHQGWGGGAPFKFLAATGPPDGGQ